MAAMEATDRCSQCKMTGQQTNGPCRCTQRWREARRREANLWNAGDLRLDAEYPTYLPYVALPDSTSAVCRRGFIDELRVSQAIWLKNGKWLAKKHPLTRVTLLDRK